MTKRASRATTKRSAAARQPSAVKRSNGARHAGAAKRGNGRNHAAEHRTTYRPSRKTVGATLGSAVSGIATYYANRTFPGMVTPEIAGLFTVVATFALGWVVPPAAGEAIVATEHGHRMASA
jgi:hypothetical protein